MSSTTLVHANGAKPRMEVRHGLNTKNISIELVAPDGDSTSFTIFCDRADLAAYHAQFSAAIDRIDAMLGAQEATA